MERIMNLSRQTVLEYERKEREEDKHRVEFAGFMFLLIPLLLVGLGGVLIYFLHK